MMEVLATINELTGTSDDQEYTQSYAEVRVLLIPASNEAVAMYEMPQGQNFEYKIVDNDIPNLKQQAEIVVTAPQASGLSTNDKFITVGSSKRTRLGGRFYLVGVCYKKEL